MFNTSVRDTLSQSLHTTINRFSTLNKSFEHIESLLLCAFDAQRIAIFQRRSHQRDLVSRYKSGSELREIKVAITPQSIAGYVSMAQQGVIVNNPYDEAAVKLIHFKLKFEQKYDRLGQFRTNNILSVPIKCKGTLLGVLEILNTGENGFDNSDLTLAQQAADILGRAFRYELGGTAHPFDYLVHTDIVDAKVISSFPSNASVEQMSNLLQSKHNVSEELIGEALSIHYQVPFINYLPSKYKLSQSSVQRNVTYFKLNQVVILTDERKRLIVLMFDPTNIALLMEIESGLGTENYQLAFGMPKQILGYLDEKNAHSKSHKFNQIIGEIDTDTKEYKPDQDASLEDEPAIVRLVSNILFEAKTMGASDIHIDPEFQHKTLVRMRVDGIVKDINQLPESHHKAVVARIKIMAGLDISEKRIPQDGKLMFNIGEETVEVRVATIPTVVGEGIVMRILPNGKAMPLDNINLSPRNLQMVKSLVTMPHGMLLVVGPTGSGKTTTLHAILGFLNTPDKKIWTAEDPVEITQYRLQQVQVNRKVGFTFEKALRAFLRADPDIILIGEMRDRETASAGIEASLTGHFVLSTLHTNSASETITRLIDMGMDPINFSDACVGIVAQRLIRTLCPSCKEVYSPSEIELEFINRQYGEEFFNELNLADDFKLHKGAGCEKCDDTGYKGRTGVHELLVMTPELRSLIFSKSAISEIKKQAMQDGMRTLVQDTILKVLKGDTDLAQAQILSGSSIPKFN
ncbi:MAG: type II secretory ATPase GspE/PulE/Tfp pilus assembly ATPase PilB-like protein [Glaciecola sp.]|jgi:type II secretory ATPase GspE/PulE/Tfp pilus assembly ATPase PilB-like protein